MMKRFLSLTVVAILVILSSSTPDARDTREMYSIDEALKIPEAKNKIDPNIRLFYGDAKHPKPIKVIGPVKINRKTNASNKSDKEACQWVFLSAVIALQKTARDQGGNAIIGIRSIYRNNIISSSTEFMCGAGAFAAGVAFEGTIVQLP